MLCGQQRAIAGGGLLRLRNGQAAGLQQIQHLLQLWWAQLAQYRVAELLANKVADRLAVVALRQ